MPRIGIEKIISNNNILAKWPSSGCNTKRKHNDYIQGRSRVRDGVKEENCMGQFESGKIFWQSTHRYKPLSVNISCKLILYSTLRTVSCVKSRSITTTVRSLSVQIGWNVRIMSVCLTVCLSIRMWYLCYTVYAYAVCGVMQIHTFFLQVMSGIWIYDKQQVKWFIEGFGVN